LAWHGIGGGGVIGATYGSKCLTDPRLNQLLSLVILLAGLKMLVNIEQGGATHKFL